MDSAGRLMYHGEDKYHSAVAFKALSRVPFEFGPRSGRELLHRSLHLALECRDLGQSLPRILLHLKVFACFDA